MFTFLHAADIHLDSPLYKLDRYEGAPVDDLRQATRRAFDNLVRTALTEKVDLVLVAGDLYDGDWRDYNTGLYFISQTSKLRDAGIPVVMVAGNHDAESKITRALRLPEGVHLLPADRPHTIHLEDLGVAVHGQSFASPAVREDLSASYPSPVSGCFNIGLLHTCATGREGHEPYAPCTMEGLRRKGYDYWALGHVHRHEVLSNDPVVVFSGNIQGRHVREAGPKGCCLVCVGHDDRPAVAFRPLDVIRWEVLAVEAAGCGSGYDVVDRFERGLKGLMAKSDGLPLVTRVLIQGETAAHDALVSDVERWTNEIRSAAVDMSGGQVWVEKVRIRSVAPVAGKTVRVVDGALGELAQLLEEVCSDPERLAALGGELADLEKKLPRELREGPEGMALRDPAWLREIVEGAGPMLFQRLLQKRGLS